MNIIEIIALTKSYGAEERKVTALDAVTFSVTKGEFLAIVGQSGSGKSTLLHLLAGLDRPDCGSVFVDGVDIFTLKGDSLAEYRRRQIGIIYQFYNLIPVLTVEENVTLPVRLDNKKVDKKRLADLLSMLNLSDRKTHLPNQLSGGQQQRTAIARALFFEPMIILADEPTGNLDTNNSNDIINYLARLNKEFSQTILLITHDEKIASRAGRVVTLSDGKIIKDVRN
ncbi:MAG: ABC transporter ATP-binding protein [Christensenellaceae bacterium]|jgi:putative ABC transport system ATP-binding protein|nr:ABC transporter ATP-binding protein [Christensenellaceae bacterium]